MATQKRSAVLILVWCCIICEDIAEARWKFGKDTPSKNLLEWYWRLTENSCPCGNGGLGWSQSSDADVEQVREAFSHSPWQSILWANQQLQMLNCMASFEETFVYKAIQTPGTSSSKWLTNFLGVISDGENLLSEVVFSNKATFHVSFKASMHNCYVWGL